MIDWNKISTNKRVIELIKQREKIGDEIRDIEPSALINYELEMLNEDCDTLKDIICKKKMRNRKLKYYCELFYELFIRPLFYCVYDINVKKRWKS